MFNTGNGRARRLVAGTALAGLFGGVGAGLVVAGPAAADFTQACGGASDASTAFQDAGPAADCLRLYGLSNGKADGTFGELDPLVRTQISSLLVRLLNLTDFQFGPSQPLSDTDDITNAQVRAEVEQLVGAGIIAGFPDGTFKGGNPLTVAQFATLLLRVAKIFDDSVQIDTANTANNVATAIELGLLNTDAESQSGTDYDDTPSATAARGLVADSLAELIADLVESGDIENRGTGGGGTNATIAITPTSSETVVDDSAASADEDDEDDSDQRTYTATGLDATEDYRVTLVNCDNISTDDDGAFSFQEDPGASGLALAGPNGFAVIASVNGTDAGVGTVGAIAPVGGSITIVVEAEEFGCVRPVIYTDGGANTRLELDDDGAPTEDFGVGGEFNSLPAEAEDGDFEGTILAVFEDEDFIVVDTDTADAATGDQFTVPYDEGDDFFLVVDQPTVPPTQCPDFPSATVCAPSDLEEFESLASRGDAVLGTFDADGDSTFQLDDLVREGPEITDIEPSTTTAVITLDVNSIDDEFTQIDIYVDEGDSTGEFDDAELIGSATEDADDDLAGFQVTIDGLDPATDYTAFAVQVVDGEDSEPSDGEAFRTLIDQGSPTILSIDGGTTTATITLDVDADSDDVDSVTVRLIAGSLVAEPTAPATVTVTKLITEDADDDADGFQVEVTGLTANTQYSVFATTTTDGQESPRSSRRSFTTDQTAVNAPALTSAAPEDGNSGSGTSDDVIATYAGNVDCGDAADVQDSTLTFGTGSSIDIVSCAEGASATTLVFHLAEPITDQPGVPVVSPDVAYTLNVAEGAARVASGGAPLTAMSAPAFNY